MQQAPASKLLYCNIRQFLQLLKAAGIVLQQVPIRPHSKVAASQDFPTENGCRVSAVSCISTPLTQKREVNQTSSGSSLSRWTYSGSHFLSEHKIRVRTWPASTLTQSNVVGPKTNQTSRGIILSRWTHKVPHLVAQYKSEVQFRRFSNLTQSHIVGPTDIPLLTTTIGQKFSECAAQIPNHPALISRQENIRHTYNELHLRVSALAHGFLKLGLTKGDRLGLYSPNHEAWVVTQFAAARLGLVLVNLNPGYQSLEVHQTLNKVGCRALVVAENYKGRSMLETCKRALKMGPRRGRAGRVQSEEVPSLEYVLPMGNQSYPGLLGLSEVMNWGGAAEGRALEQLEKTHVPDDVINIQFTSGTTGQPKGACLTHRNVLNNGYLVGRRILLTDTDKICIPVPFYHCFGMVMSNLAAITHGAAMVIPSAEFDPLATLQAVHEERCTALYGVPTMFVAELHHPDFARFDLSSLRTGIMAGSPCPVNVMRRVREDMHMSQVTICYGMTETSPVSFQTTVDDPVDKRLGTVGRIQPHTEAKVVDPQSRAILPVNTPGELVVRGYLTMKGYWDEPQKTREVKDDEGWVSTGDLAVFDERGYCSITGRIKDMVIRGGQNLFPKEIEDVIHTHPYVEDVHIIGVPDPYYGEELCAWVKVKMHRFLTANDIRNHCRQRVARYKVPRYVKFVDSYPMTVTGKVQKFKMRETSAAELQAEEPG